MDVVFDMFMADCHKLQFATHKSPRRLCILGCWLFLSILVSSCTARPNPEIWYFSNVWNQDAPEQGEIHTIDPITYQVRTIIRVPPQTGIVHASLSPDRTHIAYSENGASSSAVWLAKADGSNPDKISDDHSDIAFFWLDNQRIVTFGVDDIHKNPDQGTWMLYDLVSRQQRRLIRGEHTEGDCGAHPVSMLSHWSSDAGGGWLGHWEIHNDIIEGVSDIDVKSEQLSMLAGGCSGWTPDGRQVVVPLRTPHNAELFLISDRGRSVKQITHFEGNYRSTPFDYAVSLSPNGQWSIGWVRLNSPLSPGLPEGGQLVLASTDGQTVEFLGDFGGGIVFPWSPDSRYVAASLIPPSSNNSQRPARQVHIIDIQTKEIKQITFDGTDKNVFDWR